MFRDRIILWLRVVCFMVFAAYAWTSFNGNLHSRAYGETWHLVQGLILSVFAITSLLPLRFRKILLTLLVLGTLNLVWISWANWLNSGRGIGQLLEHASQFFAPMFLFMAVRSDSGWSKETDGVVKRCIGLTFFCHGLFAYGFISHIWILHHQTPAHYVLLVQNCLGIENIIAAAKLLRSIGIVDFIVAICIFFPYARVPALIYMVLWGFITALARPWAFFQVDSAISTLNRWIPEFLERTPHFLLPLLLLWIWWQKKDFTTAVSEGGKEQSDVPGSSS